MKCSIVIPTYGDRAWDLLKPCLDSIRDYTDLNDTQVVVVSNGCTEDTKKVFDSFDSIHPFHRLLWFDEAIGYARACNEGIKIAKGDYIVLLNNDTELTVQPKNLWIEILLRAFWDEHVAISGPMMSWCPWAKYNFLIGFCIMIRKTFIEQYGAYDEAFEAYGEDTDICVRAQKNGWKIKQVPDDEILRVDGQPSVGTGNFPIWHKGNESYRNWPGGEELLRKNRAILRERYGTNIGKAHDLDGWMRDEELRWLAQAARKAATVIELGSWHGKSTRAIADNLPPDGHVYAIDTWQGSETEMGFNHASAERKDGDHAFIEFCNGLWDHIESGKVIPLRMHGRHAANLLKDKGIKAELIFIDADHRYECVKEDNQTFLPLLSPRGIICGHDYKEPGAPGVEKAVHEVWGGNVGHPEGTQIWYSDAESIPAKVEVVQEPPRVYDCFTFYNELELLDVRLHELDSVVDRFVLVEATLTHQGKHKPLYFQENMERFAPFLHKISSVTVDFSDLKVLGGPENFNDENWMRERNQYEGMLLALKDCKDNDIIIMGGADEIARAEAIKTYRPGMGLMYLEQDLYYYYLNCYAGPWSEARILPYKMLKEVGPCNIRYSLQTIGTQGDPLPHAGWHFSFMGGAERIAQKIMSYAHGEYNKPEIVDPERIRISIENCEDVFGRDGHHYKIVELNGEHPIFVQQNIEKFRELGFVK